MKPLSLTDLRVTGLWRDATLVAGTWIETDPQTAIAVNNPADGALLGHVPKLSRDEVRGAIEAAAKAQNA